MWYPCYLLNRITGGKDPLTGPDLTGEGSHRYRFQPVKWSSGTDRWPVRTRLPVVQIYRSQKRSPKVDLSGLRSQVQVGDPLTWDLDLTSVFLEPLTWPVRGVHRSETETLTSMSCPGLRDRSEDSWKCVRNFVVHYEVIKWDLNRRRMYMRGVMKDKNEFVYY